jgi:hypothetical protein
LKRIGFSGVKLFDFAQELMDARRGQEGRHFDGLLLVGRRKLASQFEKPFDVHDKPSRS